jgi:hypothetical protein
LIRFCPGNSAGGLCAKGRSSSDCQRYEGHEAVKNGTVEIDGDEYKWSVVHQQTYTSTGTRLLGLAILVQLQKASTRDLLLQFDHVAGHRDMSKHLRFRISDKHLIKCIRNAISSGWDPEARGKKFIFLAGSPKPN